VRFHCSAANASDTSWRINGRPIGNNIADLNVRGISVETDNSLLESNLTISSVVSNNNTHILCVANHLVEFRYVPTAEATFQVQGQSAKIIYILNNLCYALYHTNLVLLGPTDRNFHVQIKLADYSSCEMRSSSFCSVANVLY